MLAKRFESNNLDMGSITNADLISLVYMIRKTRHVSDTNSVTVTGNA